MDPTERHVRELIFETGLRVQMHGMRGAVSTVEGEVSVVFRLEHVSLIDKFPD